MTKILAALEARLADAQTPGEKIAARVALAWPMRGVDPHRALALCEEAVALARAGQYLPGLAGSLNMAGACAIVLDRHEKAQAALDECLPLRRETSAPRHTACTRWERSTMPVRSMKTRSRRSWRRCKSGRI